MHLSRYLSVCFAILLTTCMSWCVGAEVVPLNDATFEHQTQASTGMTTGSWLVFFKAKRCPHCNKLMPHYEKLSQDEDILERGILLSTLDVADSPHTTNRFMIRGFPTLIFLHKKQLYHFDGKRDYESLKEFLLGGFEQSQTQAIPPIPSTVEYYVKLSQAIVLELKDAALGKSGMAGYAIIVLVAALMSIFGFIIAMFFMPAKKMKKN